MDDNAKNTSSYQLDQEILDARGIDMTVEEVAGLSTCKYSEKVQLLKLKDEDMAFLKGLRRRIKNRLASQNSRRRSVEHLRRLASELRAVRARRHDGRAERAALLARRDGLRARCGLLRRYLVQIIQDRGDCTEVPSIYVEKTILESQQCSPKRVTVRQTKIPILPECFENTDSNTTEETDRNINSDTVYPKSDKPYQNSDKMYLNSDIPYQNSDKPYQNSDKIYLNSDKAYQNSEKNSQNSEKIYLNSDKSYQNSDTLYQNTDTNLFECRIDKLVQKSVNHIFKNDSDNKKVFAKTVFISNDKLSSEIKSMVLCNDMKILRSDDGVLNLSLKEGRRKSHGRKQLAPRRIAYVYSDSNDGVLDLKIKKETP